MASLPTDCYIVKELSPGLWNIGDRPNDYPHPHPVVDAYLVTGRDKALLIDAGASQGDLKKVVEGITSLPVEVLILHGHGDHTGNCMQFDKVYMSALDKPMAAEMAALFPGNTFDPERTTDIQAGDVIDLGGCKLEILSMAGHTPGSLVALDRENQMLFGSDSLGSGEIWLQIPFTTSLSEFLDNFLAIQRQVADLPNLVIHPGHRWQRPGELGQQYLTDVRLLTEDILSGKVVGTPMGEAGSPWSGLSASRGAMRSFCYNPNHLR